MEAACAAGALVVAAWSVAGCKAKVTASDSRTVETFAVASGRVALESRFKAGIGKASSSGKWGLGSMQSGEPFAAHIGELTIDTGDGRKTEYLCGRYWGGADFPGLDDEALMARLEGVAASSFRDRPPELERCVHESATSTLLVARCRIDPEAGFAPWRVIVIMPERGVRSSVVTGTGPPQRCDEVIAKHTGGE